MTRRHPFRRPALALVALFAVLAAAPVTAAETLVAVAANFTEPAKVIAAAFAKATGDTATLSFGASGAFYTQMTHGAPFEVFLSADAERPAKLDAAGLAVPGTRSVYAVGRLVLYSTMPGLVDGAGKVLATGSFAHLAIADPATAPYGAAAVETLKNLRLYDRDAPKFVTGSSISQAYQFVATGAADLGFVAASEVINIPGGSRWAVPETLHAPIEQAAVVLRTGANNPAAAAFVKFLHEPEATAIIRRYGYEVR